MTVPGEEPTRPGPGFWRRQPRWSLFALAGIAFVYVAWLGLITLLRHRAWFSNTYDMAIFDQGTWLVAHLRDPFVTVRAIHLFGDHASYNLFLLAPLYRLWPLPGPYFLLSVQALAVGLGVIPLYRLSRIAGARAGLALAVCGAYVVNPLVQNVNYFDFHPETLSVPLFIWAVAAAWEERWLVFGVASGLAVLGKEDMALILAFVGLWLFAVRRQRRAGLVTGAAGLVTFVLEVYVLVPHFQHGGSLYGVRLLKYGQGTLGILVGLITHFHLVLQAVFGSQGLPYLATILASVGFLPLLEPGLLIPAIPTIGLNLLSSFEPQRSIQYQYMAGALPFLFAAMAVGAGRLDGRLRGPSLDRALRLRLTALVAGVVLLPALATNWLYSDAQPDRTDFRRIIFRSSHTLRLEQVAKLIHPGAVVSASYYLTSHLSGRPEVYLFPQPFDNPFFQSVVYAGDDQRRRIDSLEYVFVDQNEVYYSQVKLLGIFPNNPGETWESLSRFYRGWDILYDQDGIVLAHRPRPPPG